jgi:ketosteroid isomerase-like protein
MNPKDPKLTALQFNEHINNQDINRLSGLMTEDHTFIDREGRVDEGKESIYRGKQTEIRHHPIAMCKSLLRRSISLSDVR